MATNIDYYIRPAQRANGSRAVTVKITHNRRTKYLPTSIYVYKGDITRDGTRIKNSTLLENVEKRLKVYRDAFLTIEFPEYYSLETLCAVLQEKIDEAINGGFRLDVFEYAEKVTQGMEAKTAEGYRTAFNAVRRFAGDHLDINDITTGWLLKFRNFLENEPPVVVNGQQFRKKSKGSRAISYYLACLRRVHNLARLEFNDDDLGVFHIPRQPFSKGQIVPRMPVTDHRALTVSQIRIISEAKPKAGTLAALARDVFLLSFALAGTNTIDLYGLQTSDIDGDLLTYRRAKTDSTRRDHAEITLKVLPEAREIIGRRRSPTEGRLLDFADRYSNSHEFNRACNKGLKALAADVGIAENLTTYYARHSWATIARNVVGVDFDTVNAALNHARTGSDRITDIYIARDYSAIWKAQEAVMAEVKNAAAVATVQMQKVG